MSFGVVLSVLVLSLGLLSASTCYVNSSYEKCSGIYCPDIASCIESHLPNDGFSLDIILQTDLTISNAIDLKKYNITIDGLGHTINLTGSALFYSSSNLSITNTTITGNCNYNSVICLLSNVMNVVYNFDNVKFLNITRAGTYIRIHGNNLFNAYISNIKFDGCNSNDLLIRVVANSKSNININGLTINSVITRLSVMKIGSVGSSNINTGGFSMSDVSVSDILIDYWDGPVFDIAYTSGIIKNLSVSKLGLQRSLINIMNSSVELIDSNISDMDFIDSGSCIYLKNSRLVISNSSINGIESNSTGGAIDSLNSELILHNVSFSGFRVYGSGAIIHLSQSTIDVDRCEFLNSSCISVDDYRLFSGGAIYSIDARYISISNSIFWNCLSFNSHGGAIYLIDARYISIDNSVFRNCLSLKGYGGAISSSRDQSSISEFNTTMNLYNASFINCSSRGGGGAVDMEYTECNFKDISFHTCKSKHGGAIYAFGSKSILIDGLRILNLKSDYDGGGLRLYYSECNITNFYVEGLVAQNGGFLAVRRSTLNVFNGSIVDTRSSESGGVFYLKDSYGNFDNVSVDGCSASTFGGVFYLFQSRINYSNSVCTNVKADNQCRMHAHKSTGYFTNVTLNGCTNYEMDEYAAADSIIDCESFELSNATYIGINSDKSSAVILLSGSRANITNTTIFDSHITVDRSVIELYRSNVIMNRVNMSDRNTNNRGGALYLNDSNVNFTNCIIDGHYWQSNRGVVNILDSRVVGENSTIFGNYTASNTNIITIKYDSIVNMSNVHVIELRSTDVIYTVSVLDNSVFNYRCIDRCVFDSTLFNFSESTSHLKNVEFVHSSIGNNVSAIMMVKSSLYLEDMKFESTLEEVNSNGCSVLIDNSNITFINHLSVDEASDIAFVRAIGASNVVFDSTNVSCHTEDYGLYDCMFLDSRSCTLRSTGSNISFAFDGSIGRRAIFNVLNIELDSHILFDIYLNTYRGDFILINSRNQIDVSKIGIKQYGGMIPAGSRIFERTSEQSSARFYEYHFGLNEVPDRMTFNIGDHGIMTRTLNVKRGYTIYINDIMYYLEHPGMEVISADRLELEGEIVLNITRDEKEKILGLKLEDRRIFLIEYSRDRFEIDKERISGVVVGTSETLDLEVIGDTKGYYVVIHGFRTSNTGAIVGSVLGSVVFVGLAISGGIYYNRRKYRDLI